MNNTFQTAYKLDLSENFGNRHLQNGLLSSKPMRLSGRHSRAALQLIRKAPFVFINYKITPAWITLPPCRRNGRAPRGRCAQTCAPESLLSFCCGTLSSASIASSPFVKGLRPPRFRLPLFSFGVFIIAGFRRIFYWHFRWIFRLLSVRKGIFEEKRWK